MMLVLPVPRSPITSTLYKCSCLPADVAYHTDTHRERERLNEVGGGGGN